MVYCTNVWGQQIHRLTQKLPYLDVCGQVFFLFGFQMLQTIVFEIQIYTQKHSNIRKTISFKVYWRNTLQIRILFTFLNSRLLSQKSCQLLHTS